MAISTPFPPQLPPSPPHASLAVSSTLWHHRLGHPGPAIINTLRNNSSIACNKVAHTLCHSCQLGKHVRLPFTSSTSRTSVPFELVHCDVWTSPIASISGYRYYLVIIDDFTHFCWTYPLTSKSEVRDHLVAFCSYTVTQFSLPVKSIQADNGTEFVNRALQSFLTAKGMHLRLSCPYTSPQNGKAECTLRTLNNICHTLLIHAHMPPTYWAEALATATFPLNRRPSSAIQNDIPYALLFGHPPDYSHLRVFGCLCYPNLSTTASHKLAPRSTACVFLGNPKSHKGYRCLNLATHRVIISRHLVSDEGSFPFGALPTASPASAFDFLNDRTSASAPSLDVEHLLPTCTVAPPTGVEQPRRRVDDQDDNPTILLHGPLLQPTRSPPDHIPGASAAPAAISEHHAAAAAPA